MTAYHEPRLSELIAHVGEAIDRFRDGELHPFDVDHVALQYSRAARGLWKFCNMTDAEITACHVHEQPSIDWWQRGAPKDR